MKAKALLIAIFGIHLIACTTTQYSPTQFADGTQITMKRTDPISFVPVPSNQRTLYLEVNNKTETNFVLTPTLRTQIENHSYHIVDNIKEARFLVRVDIQRIGNISDANLTALKASHFGNSLNDISLADELNQSDADKTSDQITTQNYVMIADIKVYELMFPTYKNTNEEDTNNINHWYNGNSIDWERFYTRVIISAQDTTETFSTVQADMQDAATIKIGSIFE